MEQPQPSQGVGGGTVGLSRQRALQMWRPRIPLSAVGHRKDPLDRRLALRAVAVDLHPAFDVAAAADTSLRRLAATAPPCC